MKPGLRLAHVDESGVKLDAGQRLYVMAVSITEADSRTVIEQELSQLLLPGRAYLHHYDETLDRRLKISQRLSDLPLTAAILVADRCRTEEQEKARHQLLTRLLPRLQHIEDVDQVVIESRGGSDRSDRRTSDRLRRSRYVTSDLRIDHRRKAEDPLLWIADFLAGSWLSARFHDDPEPWQVLNEAHLIDVP